MVSVCVCVYGVCVCVCVNTHIRTKRDCLAARPGEEYFSTKARVLKPNLWMGSLESRGGKSVSTSPSSSAMWRQYKFTFSLWQRERETEGRVEIGRAHV